MAEQGSSGNVIAALVNVFFPALGQLLQGRIMKALLFAVLFYGGAVFWWLVVPGIIAAIAYVWAIIDAARWKGSTT